MPSPTPIIVDTTNFGQQGPPGPNNGVTCQNPFMFVKNGFLYQVLVDNYNPGTDVIRYIGVWKSSLDGSGMTRMDVANQPKWVDSRMTSFKTSFMLTANSRADSPIIDIAVSTDPVSSSYGVYIYTFDTTPGQDKYSSTSPYLAAAPYVSIGLQINNGNGWGIFRNRGGDRYLVTNADLLVGAANRPRLVYYKLPNGAGSWNAPVEMMPAGNPNDSDFLPGTVIDESSDIIYMIPFFELYVTVNGEGWCGFISLDTNTDTVGSLTIFDSGDIQYLYDTDRVDMKIINGKVRGVWCDFDPVSFLGRANYFEASSTPNPSSFSVANIWTDPGIDPRTDEFLDAGWGAILLSNGTSLSLGTAGYLIDGSPFPGVPDNLGGLLLPNAITPPAAGTTCAFWVRYTSSQPPFIPVHVAQAWGSALVGGVWTTPAVIYDLVANPPAGYTVGNNSEGAMERMQAIQLVSTAVAGYIASKGKWIQS